MDIGENKSGLNPKQYVDKQTIALIAADVVTEEMVLKNKRTLTKYHVSVQTKDGMKGELRGLLRSDLNHVVNAYGKDTSAWVGKSVEFYAVQNGDFANWVLFPVNFSTEERV